MQRGFDLLVAQIAIAKTGAAWLPFDADAPVDRVAVCLQDCGARLIVTDAGFAASHGADLPCAVATEVDLVTGKGRRGSRISPRQRIDARALGARPDDPAYMIYTSGSTGVPKGIVITGRNICHYLRSANALYAIGPADIVFQGASVAFDLSMEEIWIPYLVGASLFVATREMLGEADALPDVLNAAAVTVLDTVPTLLGSAVAGCRLAAADHPRGRSLPADPRGSLVPTGSDHLQFLWTDGDHRRGDGRAGRARRTRDDRRPDPELHLLRGRRRAEPPRPRPGGGTADRRSGGGGGLSQSRCPDAREVHRQPVPHGGHRSGALPIGRCGGARPRRQHPVSGPDRRPGEAARLPDRTRRDRGEARRDRGRASGGRRPAAG